MSDKLPEFCTDGFPDLREVAEHDVMQALGMLSAGIAHEISTPLGAVGCAQSTQREARRKLTERLSSLAPEAVADPQVQHILKILHDNDAVVTTGMTRVFELVKQLKRFLQRDEPDPVPVDIVETIDGVLLLAGHRLRDGIELMRDYAGAPATLGFPNQVSQILLNLVVNAAQALADAGGSITVTARADGTTLKVTVADDGPGVAPEIGDKIFEFGFTTHRDDGGTGFGLALSRHLAVKQGGDLTLGATPGGGAVFTLSLPLAAADPQPEAT